MLLRCAMEPVGQRRSHNPRVARANVIGDRVEENLHAPFMRSGHEIFVVCKSSQMRIDGIKIYRAVSVVILCGPILHHWREPQSRDSQLLQIGKVILNSTQIAAMVRPGLCAIV